MQIRSSKKEDTPIDYKSIVHQMLYITGGLIINRKIVLKYNHYQTSQLFTISEIINNVSTFTLVKPLMIGCKITLAQEFRKIRKLM